MNLTQLQEAIADTWSKQEWTDILSGTHRPDLQPTIRKMTDHSDAGEDAWFGDNMKYKASTTGARIIQFNAGKGTSKVADTIVQQGEPSKPEKLPETITGLHMIAEYANAMKGDIIVIQEPGIVHEGEARKALQQSEYELIYAASTDAGDAGAIIAAREPWKKVMTSMKPHKNNKGEVRHIAITFEAAERDTGPDTRISPTVVRSGEHPLERILIQVVYGHNSPQANTAKATPLWDSVIATHKEYKRNHKQATSVVMGDLNAALSTVLDTNDDDTDQDAREPDAAFIDLLEGAGVVDIFRSRHPHTKAWSREPPGALATRHKARRIDNIMATAEMADNMATRTGIHRGSPLKSESDHFPIVTDIPLDVANMATHKIHAWTKHKVTKTTSVPASAEGKSSTPPSPSTRKQHLEVTTEA